MSNESREAIAIKLKTIEVPTSFPAAHLDGVILSATVFGESEGSGVRRIGITLFPEIVKADLLLHQFLAAGNVLRHISEQKIHECAPLFLWTHQRRLA